MKENCFIYLAIVIFMLIIGVVSFQLATGVLPEKTLAFALSVLSVALAVFLALAHWKGR